MSKAEKEEIKQMFCCLNTKLDDILAIIRTLVP